MEERYVLSSPGVKPLTFRMLTSLYLDLGGDSTPIEQSEGQNLSHNLSRIAKTWDHPRRPGPLPCNNSLGRVSRRQPFLQPQSGAYVEIESGGSSPILSLSTPPTSTNLPLSASTDCRSVGDTLFTTSQRTSPSNDVSEPNTSTRATSPLSTTLDASLLSPSSSFHHFHSTSPTLTFSDGNEDDIGLDSPEIESLNPEMPDQREIIRNPKRWPQALKVMTLTFGSLLSVANLTKVIHAGNGLVRRDAVSFLRSELLQWKGMWNPSDQHALLSDDSITDHFVKISQTISILDERSVMDRIRLLFYRILLYQYYVRIQLDLKDSEIQKQQGIGIASYAVDFLLRRLYGDGSDLAEKKKRRKRLLHRQIRLGKRLTRLSGYLGLGILLSASDEAMTLINNTKFSDDMDIALVCYATNVFPDLPKLGKALDRVVRHMVKNQPSEEMRSYVESLLPGVQRLLESERHALTVSTLTRYDEDIHRVEVLEVFSEVPTPQGRIRRPRIIEVDLHASRKRRRLS